MTEPTYLRVQIKNASSDSHSLQPMGNHSITETSPMNHKVSSSFLKISWDLRWIRWQLLLINRQNCYLSNPNTTFHCFTFHCHFAYCNLEVLCAAVSKGLLGFTLLYMLMQWSSPRNFFSEMNSEQLELRFCSNFYLEVN